MTIIALSCGCNQPRAIMSEPLKTVEYRGGVVTFRIPEAWVEEYEEQGGGTFYEDRPDSGTLRLNVMTLQAPTRVNKDTPVELLRELPDAEGREIQRLPTGNALLRFTRTAEERGEKLVIHYWLVANAVPPKHARLANFSYTVLAWQAEDAEIKQQVKLLDNEIAKCSFHPSLGK